MIGGRVLDASTLVGFALVQPYPQALVWTAVEAGMVLAVPAAALASAWARTPVVAHDALSVLLRLPNTVVEPLDAAAAYQISQLAGIDPDAIRVRQVAACALRRGWPVVSGEPEPLRALSADVDPLP